MAQARHILTPQRCAKWSTFQCAERERGGSTCILLSQAEKAVIRWEEAGSEGGRGREGGQSSYLQDNKIVSHVSGIELDGKKGPQRKGRRAS